MSGGFILQQTKGLLEVPFSKHTSFFLGVLGAAGLCQWANSKCFVTPDSCKPEFLAEQAKIGNVIERTNAPAVFINPIINKIPGNILGPDDLPK